MQAKHYHNPNPRNDEKFPNDNSCRDVFWSIAFLLQLIAMIVLSIYYYTTNSDILSNTDENNTDNGKIIDKHFWVLCILSIAAGIVSSIMWLFFIRSCASFLIWFSLVLSLVMLVVLALIFFSQGSIIGGIIFLILAGLQLLWMYCVRDRIAFAASMLELSIEACNELSSIYLISLLSALVQAIWMIIWIMGITFIIYDGQKDDPDCNNNNNNDNDNDNNNNNNDCSKNNISPGLLFLFALSFYWTTQVIANVVHVTSAGAVATWYFLYPNNKPAHPVYYSFRRAIWNSFGSICFGSFIVALIQTIRFMVRNAQRSDNAFLRVCIDCILSCIEGIIEYFNVYAFSTVAIYGYSYCNAAKSTWELFKQKGFTMIINDDLIGGVLVIACLFAGAFAAIVIILIASYAVNTSQWGAWGVIAFFIGYGLTLCIVVVVRSAVATLFVCWAQDPNALAVTKQLQYQKLSNAWHKRYGVLPTA